MIYPIRSIVLRLLVTVVILVVYLLLLNISVIETDTSVSISDELTYLQISNIMNGTRRYSILGLNIAPIVTVMLLLRIVPAIAGILGRKGMMEYNTDKFLAYISNRLYLYIGVVSILEGVLYIQYVVKRGGSYALNTMLGETSYYIYYLLVITAGSFFVYTLSNMINIYGIGKGMYSITIMNFILAMYNIIRTYIYQLPVFVLCLIIIQCLLCIYVFYIFDTYAFKIKILTQLDKHANYIINHQPSEQHLYMSTAIGVLPFVYTHIITGLFVTKVSNVFSLLLLYTIQYLMLIALYILLAKLFKPAEKNTKTVKQNKFVFAHVRKISLAFMYFIPFIQSIHYRRLIILCIMIFLTQWLILCALLGQVIGFDFLDDTISIYSLYYISTLCMFMFLLTIRLLLLIYYTTDFCILKTYFDRNR